MATARARRLDFDPFNLVQFAGDRFGLDPNDITHIEARVDPHDFPMLVVTLIAVPKADKPQT